VEACSGFPQRLSGGPPPFRVRFGVAGFAEAPARRCCFIIVSSDTGIVAGYMAAAALSREESGGCGITLQAGQLQRLRPLSRFEALRLQNGNSSGTL
jgi:hypothetical protein